MPSLPTHFRVALFSLCLLLVACGQSLPEWRNGKLVVIVPESSWGARAEFERELVQLFAEHLHSSVELIPSPQDKIDRSLRRHHAHFAAASLRSEVNIDSLHFGPSYQTVREQVICGRNAKLPRKISDLAGKSLAVVAGSAQETVLRELHEKSPELQWEVRRGLSANELLQEVANGTADCAIANELQVADARNYHANLVAAFDIGSPSRLAWAFSRDVDPDLLREAKTFFARIQQDGTLNRLLDRYYGHRNRLKAIDAAAFVASSERDLPEYRALFQEAADLTGSDWRLLAALAYQESQWDPLATSFTNVRGMMMLTEDTADRMGVKNRLDPRESIIAGAKYLALLRDQLPDRIPEPDRTWLALAAYNQGYGHLEDARILTTRNGGNPDSWTDIKKWMPLLNQPGHYETLKHGYARGGEAVILVESIRSYYDMLKRLESKNVEADTTSISYSLIEPFKRLLR
ncbi:MAG: membrane-bound lytic murein transglycosylase MltF [Gallionella sp.]